MAAKFFPSIRVKSICVRAITSPWAREPKLHSVSWFTDVFRNRTDPSVIRMLQPPG